MPIKYNIVQKTQPGVAGGGVKKWYAVAVNDGELTVDDLSAQIEKFSALSEADIRGVIIALENVIQDNLANGKIIRLDKLGSFYPSVSSEGAVTEEEFNSSLITAARINYRPGKRISDAMKTAVFKKADK
ncbi:HU family DNA-binding protein [Chryseobacterium echinoideorum]|uniref:HU family DNA-binding protein n=1 Tax=Chryseobacterium echinoideorum TaxID=1549648 RepID=UPI0011852C2C|nr:HU family DNA-binding protein [Chryseobacterium echinoideorum]